MASTELLLACSTLKSTSCQYSTMYRQIHVDRIVTAASFEIFLLLEWSKSRNVRRSGNHRRFFGYLVQEQLQCKLLSPYPKHQLSKQQQGVLHRRGHLSVCCMSICLCVVCPSVHLCLSVSQSASAASFPASLITNYPVAKYQQIKSCACTL